MNFFKLFITLFTLQALFLLSSSTRAAPSNSDLFREYIGAEFNGIKFSDVPINPNVEFHFILSFAIDYTTSSSPSPTNGKFNVFWDSDNLSPSQVSSFKSQHSKVKVAVSLGGDSVGDGSAYFNPSSIDSWVANAVSSLTNIIQEYNLDGIDIDYEHFKADPETFAECIGRLITTLKNNGVISFASIAPFDDDQVQSHYLALWKSYGHLIDYVNFQFYAYDAGTSVDQFMEYFETQTKNYEGGKVLASFSTDGSGGLSPENGFFTACKNEYIGAEFNGIKFSDVPINPNVDFHFILSFAINYTTSSSPSPTNGKFNVFWDTDNLSPSQVSSIKSQHSKVKVAVSLGGDSVGDGSAYFNLSSVDSWVSNAVSSLTNIIQEDNLDRIDIDYEHFSADPETFAECIERLITTLKNNGVISFASIAPFDDDQVQSHYLALWKSYGDLIDCELSILRIEFSRPQVPRHVLECRLVCKTNLVSFIRKHTSPYLDGPVLINLLVILRLKTKNYEGGNVLASSSTDGSGGLLPENEFFTARNWLKSWNKLHGIFVWSADDSKARGFPYEKQSPALLAISH
ncbi:hypothetical protein LguiA_021073 [Lonicera macranthoides]